MTRPRHIYNKEPIFNPFELNSLNKSQSATENYIMPCENSKPSHRVVLIKGNHQWTFEWESGQEIKTVQAITEIAKSSDSEFDWFDAAMVCHEMSKVTPKDDLLGIGVHNEKKY